MPVKTLSLTFSLLIFWAATSAQKYEINAELTGFPNGSVFYLKDLTADIEVDSAKIANGKLKMIGKTTAVKSYWLYNKTKTDFYYTNLLIGPEKISIKGDIKDFPRDLVISGSVHQNAANLLNSKTKKLWKSRDSVVKFLMPLLMGEQNDSTKAIAKPLRIKMIRIDSIINQHTLQFINQNLNSYAALQELFWKRDKYKKEELEQMMLALKPEFRTSSYAKKTLNYLKVGEPLKKGDHFYDFSADDIYGKKYQLSAYKGKYILLDFTQTYCGPCILSAKDLKNLSAKYPQQLQLLSFYSETNKKVMLEGLNRDHFEWPNVWDAKGPDSEILLKYGVRGYPTFVLINPEGKIVLSFSGYGQDENGKGNLENAVDNVLKNSK